MTPMNREPEMPCSGKVEDCKGNMEQNWPKMILGCPFYVRICRDGTKKVTQATQIKQCKKYAATDCLCVKRAGKSRTESPRCPLPSPNIAQTHRTSKQTSNKEMHYKPMRCHSTCTITLTAHALPVTTTSQNNQHENDGHHQHTTQHDHHNGQG